MLKIREDVELNVLEKYGFKKEHWGYVYYPITCKEVNADYKHFKEYIKEITHKQPKQILMFKFDRI